MANLSTKEDLDLMVSRVSTLQEENKQSKQQIRVLKFIDTYRSQKLIYFERHSCKNNLSFKGIKYGQASDWTSRARLTNMSHYCGIQQILSQTSRLRRGQAYVVHRDYPHEVQESRAKLLLV